MLAQQRRRANARELQNLRRTDAAGAQNHFASGADIARDPRRDFFLAGPHFYAGAALAAVGLLVDQQLADLRVGPQLEVGAAQAGRAQEGFGGVPAPAAFLVDLEIADALVAAPVEVRRGRNARLLRGLRKGVQNVPAQALLFDAPLAACAVQRVGALVMVFVLLEVGQGVVPAPGVVAG